MLAYNVLRKAVFGAQRAAFRVAFGGLLLGNMPRVVKK